MEFSEKVLWSILLACSLSVLALVGWATVGSIRSNGNIDYCYVEMLSPMGMAPQYQLHGHRPWRTDRPMGVYPSLEEAKAKSDVLGCKFGGN